MTILSDIEINELCTLPKFVVTAKVHSSQPNDADIFILPTTKTYFSYESENVIKGKYKSQFSDVGIIHHRGLTDEEKANYPLMIKPFSDKQVRQTENGNKIISYGLSSFGYDVTLASEFKVFCNINSSTIDPLNFNDSTYVDINDDVCILPPNSYALGRTRECFNLPRDITAVCLSKSTYARAGCIINATVAEAGWSGELVIEICNATSLPLKIYANQGIAQLLFFKGNVPCAVSYADRNGKYMHQKGIQLPIG